MTHFSFMKTPNVRHALTGILSLCVVMGSVLPAAAQSLLRDTEIEEVLEDFTTPILRAGGLSPDSVDLYIVNDPSLNAFVTRGQKIFLHSGLIMVSDNPNQLKGVIAHEAGHIADGRIARSDYQNRSAYGSMLIAAGLGLAAILAGEGQAGAAILMGAPQFGQINVLAHTRTGESVADQYAAQYLERTGQSGKGLIAFFDKFRYQEVLSSARRYPYFRSHPLSSERIDVLREVVDRSPSRDAVDSEEDKFKLEMVKAKLRGFLDGPQVVFSKYPESDLSPPARYARSVAYFKGADLGNATREIDALIETDPTNPYFYELKAQILYESGRGEESMEPIRKAIELKPNAPLLQTAYAQALVESGTQEALEEAVTVLKSSLQSEPSNGMSWYVLGQAYGKQNEEPLAKYATAEQAYALGNLERARSFAKRAQEDLERNTPQWRRASDIIVIADTQLAKKKRYRPRPNFGFTHGTDEHMTDKRKNDSHFSDSLERFRN